MSAICLVLITVLQRLQIKHILCCVAICCSVNLIRPELQQTLTPFKSKYQNTLLAEFELCKLCTVKTRTCFIVHCLGNCTDDFACAQLSVRDLIAQHARTCWQSGRVRHVRTHGSTLSPPAKGYQKWGSNPRGHSSIGT